MSETAERETEIVAGTIGGITQKKADTWTVAVTPEGAQFAKNLWTKDVDLVESLQSKLGEHGSFVASLGAPYTVQGKEVRSWWIQDVDEEPRLDDLHISAQTRATPAAATRVYAPDLKDRMIVRQTALKAAAEIVGPRAGSTLDPDYDAALETMKAAQRFETWVYRDIDDPPFA